MVACRIHLVLHVLSVDCMVLVHSLLLVRRNIQVRNMVEALNTLVLQVPVVEHNRIPLVLVLQVALQIR